MASFGILPHVNTYLPRYLGTKCSFSLSIFLLALNFTSIADLLLCNFLYTVNRVVSQIVFSIMQMVDESCQEKCHHVSRHLLIHMGIFEL